MIYNLNTTFTSAKT